MLIIFIAIILTTIFANSHEKYIDLLPDEKKQEFLDKVARKIQESVENNGSNMKSKELTGEQFNEHNSHFQSVRDQDEEDFDIQGNNGAYKTSEENSYSKESEDYQEVLGVKPLQLHHDDVDKLDSSEESNVDLAVAGINRRSYDGIPQDKFTDNFNTDNVPIKAESVSNKLKSDTTTEASLAENSTEKGDDENNQDNINKNSEIEIHKLNSLESTTKSRDLNTKDTSNTPLNAFYNQDSSDNIPTDESTTDSIIKMTTNNSDLQELPEIDSTINSVQIRSKTESYKKDSTDTAITYESVTDSVMSTLTYESATEVTQGLENDSTVSSSELITKEADSNVQYHSDSALTYESTTYAVTNTHESTIRVVQETELESELPGENTKSFIQESTNIALTDDSLNDSIIDTTTNENVIQATRRSHYKSEVQESETNSIENDSEFSPSTTESSTQDSTKSTQTDVSITDSGMNISNNEQVIQATKESEYELKPNEHENGSIVHSTETNSKTSESNIQSNSDSDFTDKSTSTTFDVSAESNTQESTDSTLTNEVITNSVVDTTTSTVQVTQETEFESDVQVTENTSTGYSSELSTKESTTDSVTNTPTYESATQVTQGPQNDSTVKSSKSISEDGGSNILDHSDSNLTYESTIYSATDKHGNTIRVAQGNDFKSNVHKPKNNSIEKSSELSPYTTESSQDSTDSTQTDESTTDSVIITPENISTIQEREYKLKARIRKNDEIVNNYKSISKDADSNIQDNSDSDLTYVSTTYSTTETYGKTDTYGTEFEAEAHVSDNYSTVDSSQSSSKYTDSYIQDSSKRAKTGEGAESDTQESTDSSLTTDVITDSVIGTTTNDNTIQVTRGPEFEADVQVHEKKSIESHSELNPNTTESSQGSTESTQTDENITDSAMITTENESAIQTTQEPEYKLKAHKNKNDNIFNSSKSISKDTDSNIQDNSDSDLRYESTTFSTTDIDEKTDTPGTKFEAEPHVSDKYSTVDSSQSNPKYIKSYNKQDTESNLQDNSDSDLTDKSITYSATETYGKAIRSRGRAKASGSAESDTQESTDSTLTTEVITDSVSDTTTNTVQVTTRPEFESDVQVPENNPTGYNSELSTNESITDSVMNTPTFESLTQVTQEPENNFTVSGSESITKSANSDESTTYSVTYTRKNTIQVAQETELDSVVSENYSTVNIFQPSSKDTESYTQNRSDSAKPGRSTESITQESTNSASTNQSPTDSVIDMTTNKNTIQVTRRSDYKSEVHIPDNNPEWSSDATESDTQDSTDSTRIYEGITNLDMNTLTSESAIQVTQGPEYELKAHEHENSAIVNSSKLNIKTTESNLHDNSDSDLTDKSTTYSAIETYDNAIRVANETESETEVSEPKYYFTVKTFPLSLKATESSTQNSSDSAKSSENINDSVIEMTTNENAIEINRQPELKSEIHDLEKDFTDNSSKSISKAAESNKQDSNDSVSTHEKMNLVRKADLVIDTTADKKMIQVTQKFGSEVNVTKKYSPGNTNSETNSNATLSYTQDSRNRTVINISKYYPETTTNKSAIQVTQKPELKSVISVPEMMFTVDNSEANSIAVDKRDNDIIVESTIGSNIDTTIDEIAIQVTQRPEFESEVYTPENDFNNYNYDLSIRATNSYPQDFSTISLADVKKTIKSAMDLPIQYENTDLFPTVVLKTTNQNTAEVDSTENDGVVTEEELVNTIKEITEEEQNTEEPKVVSTIKQTDNDNLVSYIAKKALQNVKHELELKNIENEFENTNNEDSYMNRYGINENYWLTRRNNQPFRRSQDSKQDQPESVPAYKYSPDFVYYNPKNRLGPNEDEENSTELDTHLREGNSDMRDVVQPSEFILQLNNEFRKFGIRKRKKKTTTEYPFTAQSVLEEDREKTKKKEEENITKAKVDSKLLYASPVHHVSTNPHALNEKDIFKTLIKLPLKNPLVKSKTESKVSIYANGLKDLILKNSISLKQYDWLTTTVQIQSALTKILKLIKRIKRSKSVHPADLQILKYMVFLYNFSLEIKKDNKLSANLKRRMKHLPSNKKKRKRKLLKKKGLINRVLLYLRTLLPDLVEGDGLSQLYKFLINVRDRLFNLHIAIRHIASVTKFDRQNWFSNLQQLYLSTDEKHLRELLLHISMSRLLDLVKHSSKRGLDYDFIQFVETNKKDSARILEEMIFIEDIVHEIKINMK